MGAVKTDLKMQMRAGGVSGTAATGNKLTLFNLLTVRHQKCAAVSIQGGVLGTVFVTVVNNEVVAVAVITPGSFNYLTVSGGINGLAVSTAAGNVNTCVEATTAPAIR